MKSRGLNILIFILIISCHSFCEGAIVNKDVERSIDLRSHLVKISYKIIPQFIQDGLSNDYIFMIPLSECENLAYISGSDANKNEIKLKNSKSLNGCEYMIPSNKATSSKVLYIETVFSKLLKPHPKEILQSEKQLIKYHGNAYFYTPYKTISQKTSIQLSSQNILSYTQVKPVSVLSNVVKYGPFENIQEFTVSAIDIHYENQSPFMTATYLERNIEVSHWGNIAVEEKINLVHSGAKLKGSFSRYELQKDARSGQAAIKSYKTLLPASATGVYYRDSNGNISTSNMKIIHDAVELELRPRFTLFGGWKTSYMLGYNVPSFEYLFNNKEHFLLKMRVIDHIYDDMVVDEATVNIILPEGSTNIKLITPYTVNRSADNIYHTYLDTIGRPVISFTKNNLVENHISDFNLKYDFLKISMFQEPLLVVGFIFAMFILVIVFLRLDFSISKKEIHLHKE